MTQQILFLLQKKSSPVGSTKDNRQTKLENIYYKWCAMRATLKSKLRVPFFREIISNGYI